MELNRKRHPEDKCELANTVIMKCASDCGFSYSAFDVRIFKRKDRQREICVDQQGEFISQAREHFRDFCGISTTVDAQGNLKNFNDSSHNVFNVEAALQGLPTACLPIRV